jgi:putative nucleotidyltransferase with HDIG domain
MMLYALGRALESRDPAAYRHAERVQRYAVSLARETEVHDGALVAAIAAAALLHDIGKLGIPDHLLHKPAPLTRDEFDRVKQHTILGADILSAVACAGPLAEIVRHHHERWDGSGYPDGLSGEAIPLGSRILAIVDCYDALTSDRPYRPELSHDLAIAMISERRDSMFDPQIVDVFLRMVEPWRAAFQAERSSHRPADRRMLWLHEGRA